MIVPKGWAKASLEEITPSDAPIIYGILQPGPDLADGVAYVRPTEIVGGSIDIANIRRTSPAIAKQYERASLQTGDTILSIVGTIGKVAEVPAELDGGNITQSSCRIRHDDALLSGTFLRAFLRSPSATAQFDEKRLGTAVPRLNIADIRQFSIPLPPLAEQRRIVAKLDALTARLARARAELDRVPVLAAQLVRSALAEAFDGLAESEMVALSRLTSKIGSGSTPRGGKNVYVDDGVPFIRSQNVYFEGFDYDGLARITDGAAKALSGVTVHANDVLLNITGASIGRACIVPSELVGARVSQHVAIIRPTLQLLPDFLLAFLRTPAIQDWVWNANYGVTRQALTKGMIEAIEIPLPSVEVQAEIVKDLEAAFARADRLQAEATRARALLDRLESALLARAFRGELVPQDPNDEPAEVLLHRIRAQRAAAPKAKRGRKSKEAA